MSESTAKTMSTSLAGQASKWPLSKVFLVVGVLGLALGLLGLILGLVNHDARPIIGWLVGIAFWTSILMGCLFLVMLFHIFDAGWSVIIRRQLEHLLAGFPWVAIAFLPLLLIAWFYSDPGILWKWMNPEHVLPTGHTVADDVLYQAKAIWLNPIAFSLRAFLFFGIFLLFSKLFRYHSFALDRDADPKHVSWLRRFAAIGIFACALSATGAAVDWFMSLEYHWFSTMYGVWFFSGSMRAAIAITLILCFFQSEKGALRGLYKQAHNYDLGCMALAFTVFWAYISFSQFFLIYQANIPEETFWYNIRQMNPDGSANSWWWVGLALIFFNFLVPFLFLLWYKTKVKARLILFICGWILFFHLIDLYFNIVPTKETVDLSGTYGYSVRQFGIAIWDVAVVVGLGGLIAWAYLRSASENSIIPLHDPRIEESIHHHE